MLASYSKSLLWLCFLVTEVLSSCDWGRTPSKERFQENCHIAIPIGMQVLKDEYQDMGPDYAIYYTLQLDARSIETLINSIRRSDYYNGTVPPKKTTDDTMFKGKQGDLGVWRKSEKGYLFYKEERLTWYRVSVDTIKRIAQFEELAIASLNH